MKQNKHITPTPDEPELRNMMFTAQLPNMGPFTIRYPRGRGITPNWKTEMKELEIGKGRCIKKGKDTAILSIGAIGISVNEADIKLLKEDINVSHYDMRFVKPLDEDLLHQIFSEYKNIITIEDGVIKGGFGTAVIEFMVENNYSRKIKRLGIPDKFIEHGTQQELYKLCGYDTESIYNAVKEMIK